MRVLLVNTSERTGGAAVAANRLMEALNNNGVKVKMLVRDKETQQVTVSALPKSWRLQWHFLWERLVIWMHLGFKREHLFDIDIANSGTDITKLPEFKEADVIHLHWVNQGMLSLKDIQRILASGKPVVWTMHDIWPVTAICHYARGCEQYHVECQDCPLLPGKNKKGLANKVWKKKAEILKGHNITFVTCSEWLAEEACKSALLHGQNIISIPNTIDTYIFRLQYKKKPKQHFGLPEDRSYILFVSQRVTDPRKGMDYFVEAIRILVDMHPEIREKMGVAILGGHAEEVASQLAMPAYPLGYVSDPEYVAQAYSVADVFVLPSLEDNLPNTIMEAMACAIPCVGFRTGGIPEMIDHRKNGYVANPCDADDLARGLNYVLFEADYDSLMNKCLSKVARSYSQRNVARRYTEVYEQAFRPQRHCKS